MSISEIRKNAREALKGNWGKSISIVLAYTLVAFLVGLIQGFVGEGTILFNIIDIAYLIISVPLSFGLIISFMKLKRGEEVNAFGFIKDGFSRFGKSWGIWGHTLLKLILPIVCLVLTILLMAALISASIIADLGLGLIIGSVVLYIVTLIYVISRSLLYLISYHISFDNPELSSKECVKKSEELMKGNRGSYFLLQLSFIGWAILGVLTLCIGYLWLIPYICIAEVCFYEKVSKVEAKIIEE